MASPGPYPSDPSAPSLPGLGQATCSPPPTGPCPSPTPTQTTNVYCPPNSSGISGLREGGPTGGSSPHGTNFPVFGSVPTTSFPATSDTQCCNSSGGDGSQCCDSGGSPPPVMI